MPFRVMLLSRINNGPPHRSREAGRRDATLAVRCYDVSGPAVDCTGVKASRLRYERLLPITIPQLMEICKGF